MEDPSPTDKRPPAGASAPLLAGVPQSDVPRVYGRIAPLYDVWAWFTESRARRRCLELARIRDGESVLEVATGTGLLFEGVLRANPSGRNAGVDLTEAMLERARRRAARTGLRFELSIGDAHRLAFPEGSFDLLLNSYMFDLLPEEDFAPVLSEFHRVLRPGGRLVLVNMAQGQRWHQRLYEGLYRLSPRLMGGCRGVALEPYVRAAGFGGVHRETVSQAGFPTEILAAGKPG